jgi:hypothetical protein
MKKATVERLSTRVLAKFFRVMDTLYRRGDGESSGMGGYRVYLEKGWLWK